MSRGCPSTWRPHPTAGSPSCPVKESISQTTKAAAASSSIAGTAAAGRILHTVRSARSRRPAWRSLTAAANCSWHGDPRFSSSTSRPPNGARRFRPLGRRRRRGRARSRWRRRRTGASPSSPWRTPTRSTCSACGAGHQPRYVGAAAVGRSPVGVAFSPNGATAYVTSEIARGTSTTCPAPFAGTGRRGRAPPERAVERTVTAGCQPVRVVVAAGRADGLGDRARQQRRAGLFRLALARGAPALIVDVAVGPRTGRARVLRRRTAARRRRFEPLRHGRHGIAGRRERRRRPRTRGLRPGRYVP